MIRNLKIDAANGKIEGTYNDKKFKGYWDNAKSNGEPLEVDRIDSTPQGVTEGREYLEFYEGMIKKPFDDAIDYVDRVRRAGEEWETIKDRQAGRQNKN